MNTAETYLDALATYYLSAERPYRSVGLPEWAQRLTADPEILAPGARTLVCGPAGTGKTTLLDALAMTFARERTAIPLFVSLRNLTSSLQDLFAVSMQRFVEAADVQLLMRSTWEDLAFVLLLDGLDEVAPSLRAEFEQAIAALLRDLPNLAVVATSRECILPEEWGQWRRYEIPRLTRDQQWRMLAILRVHTTSGLSSPPIAGSRTCCPGRSSSIPSDPRGNRGPTFATT